MCPVILTLACRLHCCRGYLPASQGRAGFSKCVNRLRLQVGTDSHSQSWQRSQAERKAATLRSKERYVSPRGPLGFGEKVLRLVTWAPVFLGSEWSSKLEVLEARFVCLLLENVVHAYNVLWAGLSPHCPSTPLSPQTFSPLAPLNSILFFLNPGVH